jgi:predicted nucleotidyltransferase
MEQKSYKLEIINILLKEKSHARAIAVKLKTNHMMVVRKLKDLLEENVVDFNQEGKNKIFFLKKTNEARSYIFITENYKLIRLLSKYPELRNIINKIQNKKIKLAILFGSYAKGLAKKDSDIDIFIETQKRELKKELELTDLKLSIKIGEYNKNNNLIKEIDKNHVIIKGVEEYYEKQGFFN